MDVREEVAVEVVEDALVVEVVAAAVEVVEVREEVAVEIVEADVEIGAVAKQPVRFAKAVLESNKQMFQ